jgi:hypothetical protein
VTTHQSMLSVERRQSLASGAAATRMYQEAVSAPETVARQIDRNGGRVHAIAAALRARVSIRYFA